jgi:hypothetical protein
MRKLRSVTTGLALVTVAACCCAPAQAYQVVAFPDVDSSPMGGCALREAIETLYTGSGVDTCVLAGTAGNDEILLVAGAHTFPILLDGNNDDADLTGDFDIRKDLTITGDGAANSTIDAQQRDRVFDVHNNATLTLRNLTVTGGKAPNGALNSGAAGKKGGGIRAEDGSSAIVLDGVVVTQNAAGSGGSGANGNPGQQGGQGGDGGGVYSFSSLTVTDSVISLNSAGNGASGGSASTCTNATPAGSGGFGGFGGGIAADNGGAVITGSTITDNMAGLGGPGGCASTPGSGANAGSGGGISASNLSLTNSVVSDNQTRSGGLAAQDFDSANNGGSGRGGDGGGIFAYIHALISGSTISGNITGPGNGNSPGTTASSPGSQSGDGGGLLLQGDGSITNSTFADNHTGDGKTSTGSFAGPSGKGGGLAIFDPDLFTGSGGVVVSKSTFTGNYTGAGGSSGGSFTQSGDGGWGGAIFVEGHSGLRTFAMSDSTLTGNSTGAGGNQTNNGIGGAGGRGGAIGVGDFATVDLAHLTLADNTTGNGGTGPFADGARSDGGAIGIYSPFNASTVTARNSILASNDPATCEVSNGTLTDGGHNMVFGTQCTDITAFSTADPLLAALADNGGPTQTRAIADNSPARDAVPATGAGCTASDQRGTTRPQGSACDAGAFEIFVPPPPDTGGGGTDGGGGGGGTTTQPPTTGSEQQQPTTTTPADKTPPTVKLALTKQKLRKALKKGYFLFFTDNEPGTAVADLYSLINPVRAAKSKPVAHGTLKVTKTGKQKLVVRFTRGAKKALAKRKKAVLTLVLTVKDAAGNTTKKTAKVTLKR